MSEQLQKWNAFLQEQGAQFDENGFIKTFGHPEIERFLIKNGPVVTSLSQQALLKISGSDAQTFLQGQLTSDLKELSENKAQLSAYCDPQGNVLAIFTIFMREGSYYLHFDGTLADAITKRLRMFVMRSDVLIEPMNETLMQIGFAGEFGDLDIQRRLNTKVKEIWETGFVQEDDMNEVQVIKVPGPYHKYLLVGPTEQMIQAWQQIRINSDATNHTDWQLLDIAAAIPSVNSETSGQFTAQFFNLDKLDAINFKKGCFPGQEVIARMHYRGKITKRMLRLRFENVQNFAAGEAIELTDAEGKKYRMTNLNCKEDIFSGSLANVIATMKPLENVSGALLAEDGSPVTVEPLPYSIED